MLKSTLYFQDHGYLNDKFIYCGTILYEKGHQRSQVVLELDNNFCSCIDWWKPEVNFPENSNFYDLKFSCVIKQAISYSI